jgi:hypothetical protein
MVRLTPAQRRVIVDKVPDLANIGAGVFIFWQFVGQQPASWRLFLVGLLVWVGVMVAAVLISGGKR